MNLLAHLHVGNRLSPVAAAGNLAADFCRKANCAEYQKGLELHKKIDMFTDAHPAVVNARGLFPGELRRFSSVILDLVFDYCLSRSWHQWQATSRSTFIESRLDSIRCFCASGGLAVWNGSDSSRHQAITTCDFLPFRFC